MPQEILILEGHIFHESDNRPITVHAIMENDEYSGRYRAVIEEKQEVLLHHLNKKWLEGGRETKTAKLIGTLIENYVE
jgi:hypothetical protein